MTVIDRRRALGMLGGLGLGSSLLGTVHRDPLFRTAHHQGSGAADRPREGSDGRVIDLVLEGASAWVPGTNGVPRVVHGTSVRIAGDRIAEIRQGPIQGSARRDLRGHLLIPGLISGHTHVAGGSPTRGIIEGGRSYARPLEVVDTMLDDEDLDALTAYNLAELLRSGCTSQVEMSLSLRQARSYARMADRLGARGWVGGMIPGIGRLFPIWFGTDDDLSASEADTLAEIAGNLEFARTLGRGTDRIQGMMTPHAADTHTPATLAALAAAATELGTGIHTHLSQGERETATIRRRWGVTPTEWLQRNGLLDGPFFGAHFTSPDWAVDPPILRDAGAVYSTCPSAGGAGGGTQPYPEALAAGLSVNVGIDTHSNDMVENLKLAVLYGQARATTLGSVPGATPVRAPTVADALEGSTRIAADCLRRPDLGRIEVGARADLVAVDLGGFLVGAGTPPLEPLNNLLYANGLAVRTVVTDGRLLVDRGDFVAADADDIITRGGRVVSRIWEVLQAEGWFDPTAPP
jgi:cytosine/adenosine deaminase-related metal-dependent hydrolase